MVVDGRIAVEFPFVVHKPSGYPQVLVAARAEVIIDGGRETEAPKEAETPRVLQWHDQVTGAVIQSPHLPVTQDGESRWSVTISQPEDVAVSVTFSLDLP